MEVDALFLGFFDLPGVGRHLVARAPVDHLDVLGAQADGRAGRVHGGVAAAQHQDVVADVDRLVQRHLAQELDGVHGPGQVFARDAERPAQVSADGHEGGLEALLLQIAPSEMSRPTRVL